MKQKFLFITGVTAFVFSSVGLSGASAAPAIDLTDAQAIVSQVVPSLISTEPVVDVALLTPPASRGAEAEPPSVKVEADGERATGIGFAIDYAVGTAHDSGVFEVLATEHEEVAAYVQGTTSGVRVLTAISSVDAPSEYSYTFDVPKGTELVESAGGFRIQPPGEVPRGFIRPAWALDSAGKSLETSYTWSDNVLTQTVDLSEDSTVFPVVIDPSWSYGMNAYMGDTTSAYAWHLVHQCFNCYFPVDGAPKNYPSMGEHLPLTVGWFGVGNFNCIMDVSYYAPQYGIYGFRFISAPGHIDGEGSSIDFQFISTGGLNVISVDAWVVNDFPGPIKDLYIIGAEASWTEFGSNLANG